MINRILLIRLAKRKKKEKIDVEEYTSNLRQYGHKNL
jgi:hypothetical protein